MIAPSVDRWSPEERLSEIRKLRDGWYDGNGKAFDPAGLDWVRGIFAVLSEAGIRRPYVYPTPDGMVQAEWTNTGDDDVEARFDLTQHSVEVLVIDWASEEVPSKVLNLDESGALEEFVRQLKSLDPAYSDPWPELTASELAAGRPWGPARPEDGAGVREGASAMMEKEILKAMLGSLPRCGQRLDEPEEWGVPPDWDCVPRPACTRIATRYQEAIEPGEHVWLFCDEHDAPYHLTDLPWADAVRAAREAAIVDAMAATSVHPNVREVGFSPITDEQIAAALLAYMRRSR